MSNQKYDAFITVARRGSFKAAAEELGYTQAGISYLVNALEKELNLTLFVREYGGVHLTTEGREVLGLVQTINADEHALATRVRELNDREGGLVRVGSFTSVAIEWFPGIAKAFLAQYPKIDLKLLCIDDEQELVEAAWEGRADCAFSIAPERRDLDAVPLHTDPLLVVLPPDRWQKLKSSPPKLWQASPTSSSRATRAPRRWRRSSRPTGWSPTCASPWTPITR